MRIKLLLVTMFTSLTLMMACGPVPDASEVTQKAAEAVETSAQVVELAKCLSDPENGLHVAAGSPTLEQAIVNIQADLDSGKRTVNDLKAAIELYCDAE